MNVALTCYRARTKKWLLNVTDSDGAAIDLTGKTLRFRAAKDWDDAHLIELSTGAGIVHAVQSGATLGQATLTFTPALTNTSDYSTSRATALDYLLDLTDGSDVFTVQSGRLSVLPALA